MPKDPRKALVDQLENANDENTIRATDNAMFVAINYITCDEHYRVRFELLFKTMTGVSYPH